MAKPPSFSSVVVTTDFSELANRVIPHAYALVDDGGTVHLVHVVELTEPLPSPLVAHYRPGHTRTPEERERERAQCQSQLRALIPSGLDARRIRSEVHAVDAREVAPAVVNTARELGASALCVATHGRTGLARVVLGSVAQSILAASELPVLVVRVRRD
jgi:nucleotide-binding universal stress UspA family protein